MLPVIPADKANHFTYGAVIGAVATILAITLDLPYLFAYSVVGAAVMGVLKEVYDKVSKKGTPSIADAIVTALGGVPVSVIVGLLM